MLTPFAKSLIAPLNEMLGQANQFATLPPSNIQPNINQKIRIVVSEYAILAFLDTTLRAVQGKFPNLRLDILSLSEHAPQMLANGAVGLMLAGKSLDVGVSPIDSLYEDQFVCFACQEMDPVADVLSLQDFTDHDHVAL